MTDIRVTDVTLRDKGECRGSMLWTWNVKFSISSKSFECPMQYDTHEWWVHRAWLDDAMVAYYGKPLHEMGKSKDKNRQDLAHKIMTLARKQVEV